MHLGAFALNISKKIQDKENRRLSSKNVGCIPDGNPIFDSGGGNIEDETAEDITDG